MTDSSHLLWFALIFLLIFSGFFSGSETAMMAINRYRLRHMSKQGHKGAQKAAQLLDEPEKLISLILIGNNFVNILASAIATVIAVRLMGEHGVILSTIVLTVVVLLFAEVTPKTIAAHHPEKVALPAAHILKPLLWILSPLVWCINGASKYIIKMFTVEKPDNHDELNREELTTLLKETGGKIPKHYLQMMLGVLDLETATVEDVMVPTNEVIGIDLEESWENVLKKLTHSQHTRLPVYRENLDRVVGIIHVRHLLTKLKNTKSLTQDDLMEQVKEAYFIPETTTLLTQLQKFQKNKRRMGLVVDEYGEVLGLATLDDILEEIVGEFTTDSGSVSRNVQSLSDGSIVVPGNITIRELNRLTEWQLPTDGPKTLSGLIIETLESIPRSQTGVKIFDKKVEVMQVRNNTIRTVKIYPDG